MHPQPGTLLGFDVAQFGIPSTLEGILQDVTKGRP
jgi:hypothetical protein